MTIRSVHESVLYAHDVLALAEFYSGTLGLRALPNSDADSAACRLPDGDAVLLIFNPAYAAREGRSVPTHGSVGPGHIAFRVEPGTLDGWRQRLESRGVPIELDRTWPRGGRSVYFRDPANNAVELVDGTIWPS